MDFFDVVKNRRSIRKFSQKEINDELLNKLLQVIQYAPTAANKQPFRFLIVKNPKIFAKVLKQEWALTAPIMIVAFAVREEGWTRQYDNQNFSYVDVAIAFDHLTLAAAASGLATCWIAAIDPLKIKQVLNISETWSFVALTPLGYPDGPNPAMPPRKKTSDIIIYVD